MQRNTLWSVTAKLPRAPAQDSFAVAYAAVGAGSSLRFLPSIITTVACVFSIAYFQTNFNDRSGQCGSFVDPHNTEGRGSAVIALLCKLCAAAPGICASVNIHTHLRIAACVVIAVSAPRQRAVIHAERDAA